MGEALGGAAAQSLFGGGANTVMTRITAVGAGLFMVTCLSLAVLSTSRGSRSVIDQIPVTPEELPMALPQSPQPPEPPSPANPSIPKEATSSSPAPAKTSP